MNIINILWYISIFIFLLMIWFELELYKDGKNETKNERR